MMNNPEVSVFRVAWYSCVADISRFALWCCCQSVTFACIVTLFTICH